MVLVWRIADNLPNSPNFLPIKLSRYTVLYNKKLTVIFNSLVFHYYLWLDDFYDTDSRTTLSTMIIDNKEITFVTYVTSQ